MLAYIRGTLEYSTEDSVVVENNGIGYQIKTTASVLNKLPKLHSEITLFTYMYIREDEVSLYGFLSRDELMVFGLLIGISGVGPKAATSILSALSVDELRMAVLSGDVKAISKANGVGAKGAQRIIIELKDKLKLEDILHGEEEDAVTGEHVTGNDVKSEAALALTSLGYSNMEALRAINKVKGSEDMDAETLLKAALKFML